MAFYDADTQAAAQSALGRALATFHTPNDDPSLTSYADANFLRTRLYNYVAAIQSYVLSQCPSAVFELLWPMDVNDPDNCKLLRHINLPSQWTTRAGSDFDTFLIEGYQYPGINHDLDQATRCAQYPWKTRLGPGPLPLSDGPLLRHVAVAAGIRERQPSRTSGRQALGLRPRVPVRMASTRCPRPTTARLSTKSWPFAAPKAVTREASS